MRVRRTPTLAIAVIIIILGSAGPLLSLGGLGHRASAILADSRLTPAAATAISQLLEAGEDLADISTWADRQRIFRQHNSAAEIVETDSEAIQPLRRKTYDIFSLDHDLGGTEILYP